MLPVLRHVLQYLNVGSTQKKKVLAQMQRNDQNLFILAGGVAEVSFVCCFVCQVNSMQLLLSFLEMEQTSCSLVLLSIHTN